MRRLAFFVLAAGLPVAALAQDAVIRIEAKRGGEAAAEAASAWSSRFDNVVTFPLARGWVAIGLGPLPPAEAEARLAALKATGQVPGDSFVAVPGGDVVLSPVAAAAAPTEAGAEAAEAPAQSTSEPETVTTEDIAITMDPPQPPAPAPGTHIRLQSLQSRPEAEAALQTWRERFPEAGLWAVPGGWYGVTLGPLDDATAQAWLAAFKASGDVPRDAFTTPAADLGEAIDAGSAPDLPAAEPAAAMPPLDEVQRALRWSGHYGGDIDGKSGPMTREAIARAVTALRLSPDEGLAMRRLIDSRAAWRDAMGLSTLEDEATGLSLIAPMDRLEFDRAERSLSIYGPKDGSGAALILFSQKGGQQELLDLAGLVTALGWVPQPQRTIEQGRVRLQGANDDHIGHAEGWVRDGRAEGFVLIWPATDAGNQPRVAAEISESLARFAPAGNEAGMDAALPVTP
ncbi:peptidoglycan-binding domain-containing protein [Paracoccus spongiarum]|uniref:Peptidoglycan-binding domain-containing protein n=1 Tax=Paracoccus spongiarum TaxID=3064387 RepID=A0ABT9JFA5_9RHOB|nr:peptidoglycan-binding domain-containing protein [Paracoccus sp. 2205BS29-5]MDP5307772.1 peptidoglycan-binding domain-containing protein [Paracoccus sp. 2205BS29-5]